MGRDDYFVFGMNYSEQVILLLHLQPQVGVESGAAPALQDW